MKFLTSFERLFKLIEGTVALIRKRHYDERRSSERCPRVFTSSNYGISLNIFIFR